MHLIEIDTAARSQLVDVTGRIRSIVREAGVREGVVFLQSLHTTAALTINENADPDVPRDLSEKLARMVPKDEPYYEHAEGNSDSHVKTSLFGPTLQVIVSDGDLVLGRWQGIFFCEWDGPRRGRKVAVQVIGGDG